MRHPGPEPRVQEIFRQLVLAQLVDSPRLVLVKMLVGNTAPRADVCLRSA